MLNLCKKGKLLDLSSHKEEETMIQRRKNNRKSREKERNLKLYKLVGIVVIAQIMNIVKAMMKLKRLFKKT
jgi:hypothetical protein